MTTLLLAAVNEGRVFALDQQTFIAVSIQLLNACVLALILARFFYKPATKFMNKRSAGIRSQFEEAERVTTQANELKAEYEEKLANIKQERSLMLEETKNLAEDKAAKMIAAAKEEIAQLKKAADEDIKEQQDKVQEELKKEIGEVASLIAEKFISQKIDKATQDALFDETIKELEKTL